MYILCCKMLPNCEFIEVETEFILVQIIFHFFPHVHGDKWPFYEAYPGHYHNWDMEITRVQRNHVVVMFPVYNTSNWVTDCCSLFAQMPVMLTKKKKKRVTLTTLYIYSCHYHLTTYACLTANDISSNLIVIDKRRSKSWEFYLSCCCSLLWSWSFGIRWS